MLAIDLNQHTTFGAWLADVPALDVSGEYDVGFTIEHLVGMDMPKCPVVVLFGNQSSDRAWGVIVVSLAAGCTSMEQPNIQHAANSRRIGGGKVIQYGLRGKALAMNRDTQVLQFNSLRLPMVQHDDVFGERQRTSHAVHRVVVAGNHENRDTGLAEAQHLRHNIKAGAVVLPIAVVEVAGNQHEGGRLVQSKLHQIRQGSAAGLADFVHRSTWIAL